MRSGKPRARNAACQLRWMSLLLSAATAVFLSQTKFRHSVASHPSSFWVLAMMFAHLPVVFHFPLPMPLICVGAAPHSVALETVMMVMLAAAEAAAAVAVVVALAAALKTRRPPLLAESRPVKPPRARQPAGSGESYQSRQRLSPVRPPSCPTWPAFRRGHVFASTAPLRTSLLLPNGPARARDVLLSLSSSILFSRSRLLHFR